MAGKGLKEELSQALKDMLGIPAADADKMAADGLEEAKALKGALPDDTQAGQKDGGAAPAATTPAATETEEVGDDTLALALADALIAVQTGEEKRVALEGEVKALKTRLDELAATVATDLKALKEEAENRKALLPKAVAQALQQRASEKGAEVPSTEIEDDAKKQADQLGAKGGETDFATDPLGWMAGKAFGSPPGKQ